MDDRKRVAATVKDYLARERISREQFAFKTKLGKSTVDKLLIGLYSDRTLSIVESHTKLPLRLTVGPDHGGSPGGLPPSTEHRTPAILDKPSIAVLPFANMSGDAEQDYVADGITEDIITALARLRWLFVIARNSSFVYKGKATDVRQVAQDLGVRYVLEGSVRTAGQRIRVTGQLIDAETGKHIWAERYDRDRQDIFAVQDDITERVVAAVEPHLYAEEGYRASSKQPDSIDAWGLVVRAWSLINTVDRAQNAEAQALLRQAIAMEPRYARAHALLGWAVFWAVYCYWNLDRREGYRQAAGHAQDALSFDPSDPWARMVSGLCFSTAGQHDRALVELRTALDLNPSFALGHTAFGWALLRAGRFDEAIAETERALRMSPRDSVSGFYTSIHGLALLGAQRFDEALPFLRASVAAFAGYSGHYNSLISCCGHLGLHDEAQEFIGIRNRIGPPLRLGVLRDNLGKFAHCAVFIDGLKKAGVPE
ncbi:MAG TPA: tetratricopeptide repeat protein [Azospirillum sp.]